MEALANWVPHGVLVLIVSSLAGALWRAISHIAATIADDLAKLKLMVEQIRGDIGHSASIEQLGRMGERFDSRLVTVHETIGELRERVAGLEGRRQ